jgi:metal-dependent amidase/aminoacylase/carboxypeptidase family protein
MLRQQIRPDERIHGAIMQAPKVTNAIPEYTRTKYTIRSRTEARARELGERVRNCLEGSAKATGCKVEIEETQMYSDLIVVPPLCDIYKSFMGDLGVEVDSYDNELMPGSTDQGNVSHQVPALHALVGIPVTDGAHNHTRQFTDAAGSDEAHHRSIVSAKAMAMTAWVLLTDRVQFDTVQQSFREVKPKTE